MSTAFRVLSFTDVPGDVVYVEALTSSLYIEKETDIARHRLVFQQLAAAALTPTESVAWIRKVATEGYGNGA
jgi:hypothetical protein